MKKILMKVTTSWCGAEEEQEIELTDEEFEDVEDIVDQWARETSEVSWYWEEIE